MSRVGSYVAPVFWICDRFFADGAICITTLVVTCKIRMYHLVACGTFFQELSFSISTTLALVLIGYGHLWIRKRLVFDVHFIPVFKEFNFHFFAGILFLNGIFSCHRQRLVPVWRRIVHPMKLCMCAANIINYCQEFWQGVAVQCLLLCVFVLHSNCYQITGTATIDAHIESVFRVGFAADFPVDYKFVDLWAVPGGEKYCESENWKGVMTVKKYLL